VNTRNRQDGEPRAQEAFASSVEHERGLLCNLVANRAECCRSPRERAVLWFLQAMSWQPGGLGDFSKDLVESFPDHPWSFVIPEGEASAQALARPRTKGPVPGLCVESTTLRHGDAIQSLTDHLPRWCLDPATKLGEIGAVWCREEIPGLLELIEQMADRVRHREESSIARTSVSREIFDSLNYTLETACLTLIEGESRTGKTESGEAWCRARPGLARFVKVPSTGDDMSFFRRIAEAIGASSSLSLKGVQLRERVEKSIQSSRLMLVFDEAHFAWPQSNRREALPNRINWIRTALVDHGVPVALISTPQFLLDQRRAEFQSKWNSRQWIGRIGRYQQLPKELSPADLELIARCKLPKGSPKAISLLWRYAMESTQYAAAIEHVLKRATFEAKRLGREQPGFDDIKKVIQASALPSDLKLRDALDGPRKPAPRTSSRTTGKRMGAPVLVTAPTRETAPPAYSPTIHEC
jgi:hypothetical protein